MIEEVITDHDGNVIRTLDEDGEVVDEKIEQPEPTGTITVPLTTLQIIQKAPAGVEILQACVDIAVFLADKNIAYGNSALNPIRILSTADPYEQLAVRVDDKLNRLINGSTHLSENDEEDLLGYLVLRKVARARGNG